MTTLVRWNPARDMVQVQRDMDRLVNRFFGDDSSKWTNNDSGAKPLALDVYSNEDSYFVEAALPGFKPEAVDISVEDGVLTLKAENKREAESEAESEGNGYTYLIRERFHGSYQRSFSLPKDVNVEAVEAKFKNGVLTVTLPKAEVSKPKRIEVKAI